jgi:hypothetical protein
MNFYLISVKGLGIGMDPWKSVYFDLKNSMMGLFYVVKYT